MLTVILWILGILTAVVILIELFFHAEIKASMERDPAAGSFLEIILNYPSLHSLIAYRIAHFFFCIKLPLIPRFLSQLSRHFTGIEIHPGAKIGKGLFIDHGMGVVIGETSIIGNNVTLFQGVTLGGTGKERGKRHPTIGNNVVVGAGAKVLGNITIGDNVQIGANAVVVKNVPANCTVVGVPGRITKKEGVAVQMPSLDHSSLPDPLAQAIERLQKEIDLIEQHMKEWRQKQKPESSNQ